MGRANAFTRALLRAINTLFLLERPLAGQYREQRGQQSVFIRLYTRTGWFNDITMQYFHLLYKGRKEAHGFSCS